MIIMVRERTKERILFQKEKKLKILGKSKGRCACCGKPLDVHTMTVDHVIPLSKGGTNETSNLVALCEDCNVQKGNMVVDPEDIYVFLDKVYLDKLSKMFSKYCKNVSWFNCRNILAVDGVGAYRVAMGNEMLYFRKAVYSDLDDIYKEYVNYICSSRTYFTMKEVKKEIKRFISKIYEEGCLYFLRNEYGKVRAVVPMGIYWLVDGMYQMAMPNIYAGSTYALEAVAKFLLEIFKSSFGWDMSRLFMGMEISVLSLPDKNGKSRREDRLLELLRLIPSRMVLCPYGEWEKYSVGYAGSFIYNKGDLLGDMILGVKEETFEDDIFDFARKWISHNEDLNDYLDSVRSHVFFNDMDDFEEYKKYYDERLLLFGNK